MGPDTNTKGLGQVYLGWAGEYQHVGLIGNRGLTHQPGTAVIRFGPVANPPA